MSTLPVNPVAPFNSVTQTTWPDGTVVTTSALQLGVMAQIIRQITAQMLGLNPATDATAYSSVRMDWPAVGQPTWAQTEDVAFVRAVLKAEDYNRVRDVARATYSDTAYLQTTTYQRTWTVTWTLYGPASSDRTALLNSALLDDQFALALAAAGLYLVPDMDAPQRNPELIGGRWWERSDFTCDLYEFITETKTAALMASVPVAISLGTITQNITVQE